jgi:hypothetical protein
MTTKTKTEDNKKEPTKVSKQTTIYDTKFNSIGSTLTNTIGFFAVRNTDTKDNMVSKIVEHYKTKHKGVFKGKPVDNNRVLSQLNAMCRDITNNRGENTKKGYWYRYKITDTEKLFKFEKLKLNEDFSVIPNQK